MDSIILLIDFISDKNLTILILVLTILFGAIPVFFKILNEETRKIREDKKNKTVKTRTLTSVGFWYIILFVVISFLGVVKIGRDANSFALSIKSQNSLQDTVASLQNNINNIRDTNKSFSKNIIKLNSTIKKQDDALYKLLAQLKRKGFGIDSNYNIWNYNEAPVVRIQAEKGGQINHVSMTHISRQSAPNKHK